MCDISSFMIFVHQNLFDTLFKCTNDEGRCVYKCDYKECRNKNIHWIDHSNWVYNLKMKWNLKMKTFYNYGTKSTLFSIQNEEQSKVSKYSISIYWCKCKN